MLERFHVSLPLECPFHPQRDMFGPQQAAKRQHRPSLWTCGFCGKSFFEEKFLDLHFDNRHKGEINMVSSLGVSSSFSPSNSSQRTLKSEMVEGDVIKKARLTSQMNNYVGNLAVNIFD